MSASNSDQWGPPTRHRADDDLEALAAGSFASVRTPNGAADLLDDAFGVDGDAHYKGPEPSAEESAKFSIDDEEDQNDKVSAKEDESSAISAGSDQDRNKAGKPSKSGKSRAREAKLAKRTNQIMSDYRAYLSEMNSEDPSADAETDESMANLEDGVPLKGSPDKKRTNEGDDASHVPSITSGGDSVELQRSWTYKGDVHDVPLGTIDETDDFGHIREETGTRRKYTHPIFHSRKFKRGVLCAVVACVAIGTVAGITTAVTKAIKEKKLPNWDEELAKAQNEEKEASLPQAEPESIMSRPPVDVEPDETEPDFSDRPDTELMYENIALEYRPVWFDREKGWEGRTYLDAIKFCALHESYIPCPYEAYCPAGEGNLPLGGMKVEEKGSWAPIINSPNEWVQVGDIDTCMKYTTVTRGQPPMWGLTGIDNEEFTRHLLCCREPTQIGRASATDLSVANDQGDEETPADNSSSMVQTPAPGPGQPHVLTDTEQDVLDNLHPIWFGRKHGYSGSTHEDAVNFCKNINGMHLCSVEAYCPNGPVLDDKPLFLRMDSFEGEQWAPVSSSENGWVLVGKLENNPATTCLTHMQLFSEPPSWGVDGTYQELKEHIMCCTDPGLGPEGIISSDSEPSNGLTDTGAPEAEKGGNPEASRGSPSETSATGSIHIDKEIADQLKPVWLDGTRGWNGGSHNDAILYCQSLGGKSLCPYAAYCPRGAGQAVMGGHFTDFNAEGEQWAPVFGLDNHWVMVGRKHDNSATTCLTHEQLEGHAPDWGLDSTRPDIKKHIMCCTLN